MKSKKGSVIIGIVIIVLVVLLSVTSYYLFFAKTTCTDSDKGKDYMVKGTAYGLLPRSDEEFEIYVDECLTKNADGDNLKETFCNEDKRVEFEFYKCPRGCTDGACRLNEKVSCVDSDGGRNYEMQGSIIDDIHEMYPSDYCISAKTIEEAKLVGGHDVEESPILAERYCRNDINYDPNGNGNHKTEFYECPGICRHGECVPS